MKQVQQKPVSENPFFGSKALLRMQKELDRTTDQSVTATTVNGLLRDAWIEAKTDLQKELFFILIFSVGDVSNRQHNMFMKKVDQGGHSKRRMLDTACSGC